MRLLFIVLGSLFLLFGVIMFAAAKGAPHEIEALVGLLIGAVFLTTAATLGLLSKILEAINQFNVAVKDRLPPPP
jgi:hypothetical protein